jgi:hypothetical protein
MPAIAVRRVVMRHIQAGRTVFAQVVSPVGLDSALVSSPDDYLRPLRELVERQVLPTIDWYQRKKRWPRRLHKSTTAVVIILGAMIPIATAWSGSTPARVFVGALGVTITTVTSLAVSFDWYRRWRLFSIAQSTLETELATWEFTIAKAQLLPAEEAREAAVAATSALLEAANRAQREETEAFFESQGDRAVVMPARPDEAG